MHPSYTSKFPELGFYGLPGHSRTPRDILQPAKDADANWAKHREPGARKTRHAAGWR